MNVAIVHDYLNQRGGAERVFSRMAQAWPGAPIYTALYDQRVLGDLFAGRSVRRSYLERIPFANRYFRALAPLYPKAFEAFDFTGFDTIVSSTTAWAKGVRVPPGAVHVCYIHTVSRFAFATDEYVPRLARPFVSGLIAWDREAAKRPTRLVANSRNVAQRIRTYYGRESEILHCPVDLERFTVGPGNGEYFIVASRLMPYKRIELAIRAAALAGVPLLIAGCGPAEGELRKMARGTTTTLLGYVSDARLNELIGNARAAIVPGEEDFGLVALEAALGLVFDPRYRDIPFAPLSASMVPFLVLRFSAPRSAGPCAAAETVAAGALAASAVYIMFNETFANWQSVWFCAGLFVLAVILALSRDGPNSK